MRIGIMKAFALVFLVSLAAGVAAGKGVKKPRPAHLEQLERGHVTLRDLPEIGKDNRSFNGSGVQRRDPSDVIKLGDTYYVFYSKSFHSEWPKYGWKKRPYLSSGYYGTIWYATSPDGLKWTERGEALGRGAADKLDSNGCFSPNVIQAPDGKVYMAYCAVPLGFKNNTEEKTDHTNIFIAELIFDTEDAISGVRRLNNGDPILSPTPGKGYFDSFRVDDPCLLWRDYDSDGKMELGLYYKGAEAPCIQTMMGLAIAESPEEPFIRHSDSANGNVAQNVGHEMMVFALGDGVVSLVSNLGNGLYYDKEGTKFAKVANFAGVKEEENRPRLGNRLCAPGAYRKELTDPTYTDGVKWGISMIVSGTKPYLVRWDSPDMTLPGPSLDPVPPTWTDNFDGEKLNSRWTVSAPDEVNTSIDFNSAQDRVDFTVDKAKNMWATRNGVPILWTDAPDLETEAWFEFQTKVNMVSDQAMQIAGLMAWDGNDTTRGAPVVKFEEWPTKDATIARMQIVGESKMPAVSSDDLDVTTLWLKLRWEKDAGTDGVDLWTAYYATEDPSSAGWTVLAEYEADYAATRLGMYLKTGRNETYEANFEYASLAIP